MMLDEIRLHTILNLPLLDWNRVIQGSKQGLSIEGGKGRERERERDHGMSKTPGAGNSF